VHGAVLEHPLREDLLLLLFSGSQEGAAFCTSRKWSGCLAEGTLGSFL
jgi:hypothetical protein